MKKKLLVLVTVLAVMFAFAGCGVKITDISLADITMGKGESIALNTEFVADKANADAEALNKAIEKLGVTYTVADETIAKLEGTTLTALEAGETTITAASADGTLSVTAKVVVQAVVEEVKAEDILVNTADGSVAVEYTLLPKGAKAEKIEFAVADENVATVKDGKLAVVAAGKTELAITADGVEKTVAVVVLQAPKKLAVEDMTLEIGASAETVVDTGLGDDTAEVGMKYTYTSADEDIAAVDENGVVTGVAAGETTITVVNELGQSCEFEIKVTEVVKQTITTKPIGSSGGASQGTGSSGNSGTPSNENSGGSTDGDASTTTSPSTPAPTPAPPASEPTPTVTCSYCGGTHDVNDCPSHYHGNGTDAGTCPVCGRGYSPDVDPSTAPDFGVGD